MYLKPITVVCIILFLVAVLASASFASEAFNAETHSTFYVKQAAAPVANNCQIPFEEKEEVKNQDSVANFPILSAYIIVSLFDNAPAKIQVSEYGSHALTGNTPLYLSKRALLL
jgi:hypothetical protein